MFPPTMFLDGEIWFGRGFFAEAQKTVFALLPTIEWPSFRTVTFDVPAPRFRERPFEYRYSSLLSSLDSEHPFIALAHRMLGQSKQQVTEYLHYIINNEGEGIILRKPHSLYEAGRTETLLKLKATRGDREALVVRVDSDKSLLLQLPTGETFSVHKKNVLCSPAPSRGDIVSITVNSYRNGEPCHAQVVRVRKDILDWRLVSFIDPKPQLFTDKTQKVVDSKAKPVSYGRKEKQKSARSFFESIAIAKHLDPLVPENWYSTTQKQIKSTKGGRSVLLQYNGSYINALINAFPEVRFDVRRFAFMPMNFWREVRNRRQFFVNMARKLGFDPLIADNWHNIDEPTISMHKGAASVVFYYRGGFIKALLHLFPEIGLDETKFVSLPYNQWANVQHRRTFLENFAQKRGCNPLNPEHWYNILTDRIFSAKNVGGVLACYKGSITNALLHLFPNIGLNSAKLLSLSRYYWQDVTNRRNFFVYLAKEKGFDPLIARNWYDIPPEVIVASTGAHSVLAYYSDDYVQALVHLFPEIGLNPVMLSGSSRNHLTEAYHRKKLEKLARQQGFDPLLAANWYSLPKDTVLSMKGGSSVLFSYGHSVSRALMHLFPDIKWDVAKFRRKRKHWDVECNRREFFIDFAVSKDMDHLNAEHWYKVPAGSVLAAKSSEAVLRYYSGNFGVALQQLFPGIGIDLSRFISPPKKRWKDKTPRRKFFEDVANYKSFNPLEPTNWYTLTYDVISKFKGARSILWHYGGSLAKALIDIFPDVNFNVSKFTHSQHGFWKDEKNRREFFEHFAEEENFSPLVARNWYDMVEKISKHKGTNSVLHHHGGSILNALVQLFPDVQFDENQFARQSENYWLTTQNRRKFFKSFAAANSFEPLVASNWYSVPKADVMATQGAASVLSFYKGNLPRALMGVFPDIGLNERHF